MNLHRRRSTIRSRGYAHAACMPGASSPLEVQRLYFANFRARIRDLPSIPAYRFSHAKGFNPARIPDKNSCSNLPWIIRAVNLIVIIYKYYYIDVVSLTVMYARALTIATLVCGLLSFPHLLINCASRLFRRELRYKLTASWWVPRLTNKAFRAAICTKPKRPLARVSDIRWSRA